MEGATGTAAGPATPPAQEATRLSRLATEAEGQPDRARHREALKVFLAYVEAHRDGLRDGGPDLAESLDRAAVALYRLGTLDLAARAVEIGLEIAPGSSRLLHHQALILLAQNRDPAEVLRILDQALEGNPHDKTIWATKADALTVAGRTSEAADAYLRAQRLDATSTQYVDRALKLAPRHPQALRLKVDLARAHGGDRSALQSAEALLAEAPGDPDLLSARAELLLSLGDLAPALEAADKALGARPEDPHLALLRLKALIFAGRTVDLAEEVRAALPKAAEANAAELRELAQLLESRGAEPTLAVAVRERVRDLEPRNLANLQALAALAHQLDRPDLGLAACRTALETSPDNLEAMRGIAEFSIRAGDRDAAFEAYRKIAKLHPEEVGDIRQALRLAREAGRGELVEEFAHALSEREPHDPAARVELARMLRSRGETKAALAHIDALLAQKPEDLSLLEEKRTLLVDSGDQVGLVPVYDAMFRLDPTRSDLALERGNLYLTVALDRPEGSAERSEAARQALVSFERASLDPERASQSQLGVARAGRLLGEPGRAIEGYRRFLAEPANAGRGDVVKELGHALREAGQLSEAEEAYGRAIALGAEDPDLLWGEVELLALLNQEGRALRYLDLLLAREPTNPLYLRRKGQLLIRTGDRAAGLSTLRQAVEGVRGDAHGLFEVAEALRAEGAYADAIQYYQDGLALDPKSRGARLALAQTLTRAGQHDEAVKAVDALLREEPNQLEGWKARADGYRALGRPNEVLYSLRGILLLDPQNGPALLEKYRLHESAGEKTDAYETLRELLSTTAPEAEDSRLLLELGDLAAALGHPEEANQAYERAAQVDPSQIGEVASRRARVRLAAGRPDLALEILDSTLREAPPEAAPSVGVLLLRAEILTALERPAEAQQVYAAVRQRDASSVGAIEGFARSLVDQGHHAEARDFLRSAIPTVPPAEALILLLAEAESGAGDLASALEAVRKGTEILPKSSALWRRLGEIHIAREEWADASKALNHAIALHREDVELLLRAGFVAERLSHPNEALALYDRATEIAPSSKYAWSSRGLALLQTGRAEDAQASFDRALSLDADFEAAKEGRKTALQKTRDQRIQKLGREALQLEARLNRPVTKNDLFVTLHVPYELLEPVLQALSQNPKVDIARLSETELRDLETASYHLITAALSQRPQGIERRGLSLADVAVLSPPTATLEQLQRLFGYLRGVLEQDLRPENLRLTPDVEELARRALLLPAEERTLFQLVRNLRVGLFKARLIKAVESGGSAVHAPLPAIDFSQVATELGPAGPEEGGAQYFAPESPPATMAGPASATLEAVPEEPSSPSSSGTAAPEAARCVGCGGLASIVHLCGAPVCQHCIAQFHTCPRCGAPVSLPSAAVPAHHAASHAGTHPRAHATPSPKPPAPAVPARPHPSGPPAEPAHAPAASVAARPSARPPVPAPRSPARATPSAPPAKPSVAPAKPAPAPEAEEAPAKPVRPRPADDEPRL